MDKVLKGLVWAITAALAMTSTVHASLLQSGQRATASFTLAAPPTGYATMFSELGFNMPGHEVFDYTIFDGNTAVYTNHVDVTNPSYFQWYLPNPITSTEFRLVVDAETSFNLDRFNVIFYNNDPSLPFPYPDWANALSVSAGSPANPFSENQFVVTNVVPEPASIALMIGALGALGLVLRQSR